MRPDHVPNGELDPSDVPADDAPWGDVAAFGHTFHAYRVAGSVQRVSRLAAEDADRWQEEGTLPDDLTRLRLDLFATVRRAGDDPDVDTDAWARALVAAIGRRAGTA